MLIPSETGTVARLFNETKMTKAALFHTSAATLGLLQALTAKFMSDDEIVRFVDESMKEPGGREIRLPAVPA